MLIESSFPNSISTALSFATDHGQMHVNSLCDWSNCGETLQKPLRSDILPSDSCKEATITGEEELKSSRSDTFDLDRSCSDLSAVKDMCASSAPKRDGYVYKRRKLQRNTVALLPEEKCAAESTKKVTGYHPIVSSIDHPLAVPREDLERAPSNYIGSSDTVDNGNPSVSRWFHLQNSSNGGSSPIKDAKDIISVNLGPNNRCSIKEEVPVEASLSNLQKSAPERYSCINNSCSTSKTSVVYGSNVMKAIVDNGECSSSDDIVVAEQLGSFSSVKELCVYVLKSHGLLGGAWTMGACASLEVLGLADNNCNLSCKVCGCLDNPLKMLICDLCEEAFHRSCCNPHIKKLPVGEWYCQNCSPRKQNTVVKKCTGKSSDNGSEMPGHHKSMSHRDLSPILSMLRDGEPYTSRVRISNHFQAEVPQWSNPVLDHDNYFDKPVELDPTDRTSLNGWSFNKPSIGNWIQCREVIYNGNDVNDEGTVCGKWRRAPLFEVQTEDWDCSCALVWDPIHADCAVPQELETDIILKHLKYLEVLKPRLANNKQKADQTRGEFLKQTRSNNCNVNQEDKQ